MGMCYRLDHNCGAPVILCDHCGFEIQEAAGQNVLFKSVNEDGRYQVGAYVPAVFVHVECTRQYEARHGGHHAWNKIDDWLFFLKNNCGITKKVEQKTLEKMKRWIEWGWVR
jgi:hypothetical protein